jgi:hypothetical protein
VRQPRLRQFTLTLLIIVIAVAVSVSGRRDAKAQNLFDFLGRMLGGPRIQMEQNPLPQEEAGPSRVFCVRLCDGAFFPLSPGKGKAEPKQLCNSLCPAAETAIYRGSKIDHAVSERGASYSNLKKAFLYREQIVEQCTCNGRTGGMAAINAEADPTLRPGDYVVTTTGVKKFNGSKNFPYSESAFSPAKLDNIHPAAAARGPVMSLRVHPRPQQDQAQPIERNSTGVQAP